MAVTDLQDDELEALAKRAQQRFLQGQLQDQSPGSDLALKIAAGGLDLLSKNAQDSQDIMSMATGVKGPNLRGPSSSDALQRTLAARDTATRQQALDDLNSMSAIQKLVDAKKEREKSDLQRRQTLSMGGYSLGEDGMPIIVKGGKADLENRKLLADISSSGADRFLNRQLKQAQIDALKRKADPSQKEFKKEQYDAATFAQRMRQAEDIFSNLGAQGYDRATIGQGIESQLPGALQNESLRSQEQAEKNFVNAILRRESGAAISPQEYANAAEQYFPRPGDSQQVKAQKAANREQAIAGIEAAAGGALSQVNYIPAAGTIKQPPMPASGGLTPEEKAELDQLRRELGSGR